MHALSCPERICLPKDADQMRRAYKLTVLSVLCLICSMLLLSCSASRISSKSDELPILRQDELIRPYTRLGRIQITREVFGTDYSIFPDVTAWGLSAVRHEAAKMGADAVILADVTGRTTTHGLIPSTEYLATGFAIKFK